jgi:hypothetical protein
MGKDSGNFEGNGNSTTEGIWCNPSGDIFSNTVKTSCFPIGIIANDSASA